MWAKFCQTSKTSINSEWNIWSQVYCTAWSAPAFQSTKVTRGKLNSHSPNTEVWKDKSLPGHESGKECEEMFLQQQQVEGKCSADEGRDLVIEEIYPLWRSRGREHRNRLGKHQPMGNARVHTQTHSLIMRPLLVIFERLWCLGEVPEDWKKANVTPIFKNEDLGNYELTRLTTVPLHVIK